MQQSSDLPPSYETLNSIPINYIADVPMSSPVNNNVTIVTSYVPGTVLQLFTRQ